MQQAEQLRTLVRKVTAETNRREEHEAVAARVKHLPPFEREVFDLFARGLSPDQIRRQAGLPKGGVTRLERRIRTVLRLRNVYQLRYHAAIYASEQWPSPRSRPSPGDTSSRPVPATG